MNKEKLTIKIQISQDDFENIIVGALEGGSNYWYCLGDNLPPKDSEDTPLSTRIATKLFTDPEYKLPIYDIEDPEGEPLGWVSQQSILDAYEIIAEKWPHHFSDMISDNHDANTADTFFQVATMGDIVFE